MVIDESKKFKDIFTNKSHCDFCNRDNKIILRVIVHPLMQMTGSGLVVQEVLLAKKCQDCCNKGTS